MTNCFEYIFIYSKNSSRAVGTKEWNGNVTNIINIKGNQNNEYSNVHKALFPENLVEYILTNFVKENGKVLDIFGGLGTTLIVAKKLNMNATMIEISKDYCRLAKERIDNNLNLFDITND